MRLRIDNLIKFVSNDQVGILHNILFENIDFERRKESLNSSAMYSSDLISMLIKSKELLVEKVMQKFKEDRIAFEEN